MSIWREARFDLHRHAKGVIVLVVSIVFGLLLLAAVVLTALYYLNREEINPPTPQEVPVAAYGHAAVQVLDCVYVGPEVCPEYARAQDYLILSTTAGGIEYAAQAQGQQKTVQFTADTPRTEWRSFAADVTRDGLLNPTDVRPSDFNAESEQVASFVFVDRNGNRRAGQMTFSLTQQQVVLRSVTLKDDE